jgi:hypothetical protein
VFEVRSGFKAAFGFTAQLSFLHDVPNPPLTEGMSLFSPHVFKAAYLIDCTVLGKYFSNDGKFDLLKRIIISN